MTVLHVVAMKSEASPEAQQQLISSFEALTKQCLHPSTNKPYITSFRSGRQNSPEGKTKGMELIFVLEFESLEDRDYYLDKDPAHIEFKNRVPSEFKVTDAAILDFEDGKW